jgi:hypothetical protein
MGRISSAEEIAIATMAGGRERRKQHRFPCDGPAEVFVVESGIQYLGDVRDLSLTGCYIATDAMLRVDRCSRVELCLCVNGEHFSTPARLVLARLGSGAAFEFLPVEPRTRSAHLALIERLTAERTMR